MVTIIAQQRSIKGSIALVIDGFWEITLLYMGGIRNIAINSVMWYLSAMLLCMAILYPLIRKYPDTMIKIVIPLATIFILGYLYQTQGTLRNPSKWIGFTYKGNLRAFAEIGLGALGYKITQKLKVIPFNFKGKLILTVMEWSCYGSIILYMWLWSSSKRDYFFLIVFWVAVILSFSEQSLDQKLYSNKVCNFLGKYSFSIYLCHIFYAVNFYALFPFVRTNELKILVYVCISLLSASLVMALSNYFRKSQKSLAAKILVFFIKN